MSPTPEDFLDPKLQLEPLIEELLTNLGFNVNEAGFLDTPFRVAEFYRSFVLRNEPKIHLFPSTSEGAVELCGYETWGLCPHHLLPVKYIINISYTPNGQVFGISKLPRIADFVLRNLPLQEDLPRLIVEFIKNKLDVRSCSCSVCGMHLCMIMRGVRAHDCTLTTSHTYGGV